VEPDAVGNRKPLAGEPQEFLEVDYSADRKRLPGITALRAPRPEQSRALLPGRSPLSIATLLTSEDGLRMLEEQWRKGGSPAAWEMVGEADAYRAVIQSRRRLRFPFAHCQTTSGNNLFDSTDKAPGKRKRAPSPPVRQRGRPAY
jgi:hypothetical protein